MVGGEMQCHIFFRAFRNCAPPLRQRVKADLPVTARSGMTLPCRPSPSHPFQRQTFPPTRNPFNRQRQNSAPRGGKVRPGPVFKRPCDTTGRSQRRAGGRRVPGGGMHHQFEHLCLLCESAKIDGRGPRRNCPSGFWNWQFFFVLGRKSGSDFKCPETKTIGFIRSHKWKFSTKIVPPQFSTRYSRVPAESVLQSEASLP